MFHQLDTQIHIPNDFDEEINIVGYETAEYMDGGLAILLYEEEGLYGDLTVNLPFDNISAYEEDGETLFRMNHGIGAQTLGALEEAGLIKARPDVPSLHQGFVDFKAYEFLGALDD